MADFANQYQDATMDEYYEYSTVILRLQGRLQFKGKPDYTLDDVESIERLFNE